MGGESKFDAGDFLKGSLKDNLKTATQVVESPFRSIRALAKGDIGGAFDEFAKPIGTAISGPVNRTVGAISDISGMTSIQEQVEAEQLAAQAENDAAIKAAENQRKTNISNKSAQKGPKIRLGASSSLGLSRGTGAQI